MTIPSRRGAAWLLLTVSGLFLSLSWVLASPIGASPDEAAHIAYAWGTVTGQTVTGEHLVVVKGGGKETRVQIPQKLLQFPSPLCYAFHPERAIKSCSPIPADNQQMVTRTSYMSRYPPLYYVVEGVELRAGTSADLSGLHVLYGARLVSAVLSLTAAGSGIFLLLRRFPDRVVLLAALLALPATAWFMTTSVNPNGLEITAAFLLAAGVLAVRVDHCVGVRSVTAVLAVPVGTLLLAWTRPVSWLWAVLILGVLLVPTGQNEHGAWRRRLPVLRLGVVAGTATAVALVSSMLWFLYALRFRALESESTLPVAGPTWAGLSRVGRAILLVFQSGPIISSQIGLFGWTDTTLPSLAVFSWVSVTAVAAAIWVVGRSTFVPRWCVVAVLGLGYLAALVDEYVGAWGWQGRYLLPVTAAVCVLAVPGLMSGFERLSPLRSLVPWMLVALMAVNALSVVWYLFRNGYGVTPWPRRLPPVPLPVGTPTWTPPLGQGAVLALVALALGCGVAAVWGLQTTPSSADGAAGTEDGGAERLRSMGPARGRLNG